MADHHQSDTLVKEKASGEMKFPRRSLRLFMSKSALKKRNRFSPEEVKDAIDLTLSSNGTEDGLAEDQLMSCSRMTESSGRRNDQEPTLHTFSRTGIPTEVICMTEPVGHTMAVNEETVTGGHKRDAKSITPGCLSGCAEERLEDDEEDCLTIAQLLSRSRKIESSTKGNDRDDEPLPDVCSEIETSAKVNCRSKPVESSGRSLSSSGKCENRDSPAETQRESESRKSAVVSETNHAEANNDKVELAKEEVVREANTVNGEEESHDKTASASELPALGLKARILRLEQVFNMIKAQKNVSSSREI